MKKTIKSIALLLIMGALLILLTGCGEDKLVATKSTEDEIMGKYNEEVVVTFKNDIVDKVQMSMEFESKETAEGMYGLYNMGVSMSDDESLSNLDVKLDNKKLVITMDAKLYAQGENLETEDMTKDAIKASLEESGYTVK